MEFKFHWSIWVNTTLWESIRNLHNGLSKYCSFPLFYVVMPATWSWEWHKKRRRRKISTAWKWFLKHQGNKGGTDEKRVSGLSRTLGQSIGREGFKLRATPARASYISWLHLLISTKGILLVSAFQHCLFCALQQKLATSALWALCPTCRCISLHYWSSMAEPIM